MDLPGKNGHSQTDEVTGAPASNLEWSELVSRAVGDLSRIIKAEVRLLELGLAGVVQAEMARLITAMVLGSLAICAGICLLAALVLFLHQWLMWWGSFGVTGGIVLLLVATLWVVLPRFNPPAEF
ncbi:MAG: phage holin family protein [Candidatus Binataceae bacterium]|nr:phage holin family protein [Candidatus Binataceae bacterium]